MRNLILARERGTQWVGTLVAEKSR